MRCLYRLRVKDINEAIKELGQMISVHTGCRQPMTRLMIVQEAVNVITNLELKLKGMPERRRSRHSVCRTLACVMLRPVACCTPPRSDRLCILHHSSRLSMVLVHGRCFPIRVPWGWLRIRWFPQSNAFVESKSCC